MQFVPYYLVVIYCANEESWTGELKIVNKSLLWKLTWLCDSVWNFRKFCVQEIDGGRREKENWNAWGTGHCEYLELLMFVYSDLI